MMPQEEVRSRLLRAFPDADVEIVDLTGTRDHYQVRLVSPAFAGKTPIEQHRLVYDALGDAMRGPIHALALKTFTPEGWAATVAGAALPVGLEPEGPGAQRHPAGLRASGGGISGGAGSGREPKGEQ